MDPEQVHPDEPMSKHTTFRTGGNAEMFLQIGSIEQLQQLLRYLQLVERPYYIVGNGSNLLVSDKGYDGTILQFGSSFSNIRVEGNCLIAQSGAMLGQVANMAAKLGLTGMEFASGIPGTIGGAVRMNAGAYDGEMSQIVKEVSVLDREGKELILDADTMEFGYRKSAIQKTGHIVTEVRVELQPGNEKEILDKMKDLNERRRDKQPLEYPSAGSSFKRPEGYFAGKLIQDAGLAGFRLGGAAVSSKHCGFIINEDHATSSDIRNLMQLVTERVYEQFNVRLEPEIIFLGEF